MNPAASDLPTPPTLLPERIIASEGGLEGDATPAKPQAPAPAQPQPQPQAPAPFVFPTELKKYSPIYKALYGEEVNEEGPVKPILMVFSSKEAQISEEDSDELKAQKQKAAQEQADKQRNDYFKTIKEYVGDDKQKIIFIQNYKSHWTVYEGSKNDVELKKHEISDNGYCGVLAAIVASILIEKDVDNKSFFWYWSEGSVISKEKVGSGGEEKFVFKFAKETDKKGKTKKIDKQDILEYCFGNKSGETRNIVSKLIDNLGISQGQNGENLWLDDSHIMEIINHRNREAFANINLLTDDEAIESIGKTQSFERKIAFLKYLNSESVDFLSAMNGLGDIASLDLFTDDEAIESIGKTQSFERKIAFLEYYNSKGFDFPFAMNGVGDITPQELLSEEGIGTKNYQLCIDVLEKFTAQLNRIIPDVFNYNPLINKDSFKAFHGLMRQVIDEENFNFTSENIIVREREFSDFQNSFDEHFKNLHSSLSEEEKEEYELQKNAINKKLTEKLLPIIQAQKESYSQLISADDNFFKNILGFNIADNNTADSFKNRIDKLKNHFKDNVGEIALLANRDEDFLEAIIPERNQLKPKVPFKGWGLRIRFEDDKIFIDDKEVKSVMSKVEDGGEDIIAKLRKDFPDNPKLFQLGFIDFFRNAESAKLNYVDNTSKPLNNIDKKTLICDDSQRGFTESTLPYNEKEIDKHEFFKNRLNKYRGIEEEIKAPPAQQAQQAQQAPPAQQARTAPDKRLKPSAQEMLEEIKKHIDIRFELIEQKLKDKNAIIVIPGSYDNSQDGYKHYLGSGHANRQWLKEDSSGLAGSQCKDYMDEKIKKLTTNYSEQILFGNVGVRASKGLKMEYYLPQYPMLNKFEEPDQNVQLDPQKVTTAQGELVIKYASLCAKLKLTPIINGRTDGARIEEYRQFLFTGENAHFKDKEFYHVWGANVDNFNILPNSNEIVGGGQAEGFRRQNNGVIGIVTTPFEIKTNGDLLKLSEVCKTYGQAPSQKPRTAVRHRPGQTKSGFVVALRELAKLWLSPGVLGLPPL